MIKDNSSRSFFSSGSKIKNMNIPKIIHQTWKTEDLSTHSNTAQLSQSYVIWYHPDWEYKFWTDNDIVNFVENKVRFDFPDLYSIYNRLPLKIMRIDFVRYLWMYYFGGAYLDLDILCFGSLEDLFHNTNNNIFFIKRAWYTSWYKWTYSVHQAWLASSKNHIIWLDIMHHIGRNIDRFKDDVLNLTGPNGVSRALDANNLLTKYKDISILSDVYFYQRWWSKSPRNRALMEHVPAASWKDAPINTRHHLFKKYFQKMLNSFKRFLF